MTRIACKNSNWVRKRKRNDSVSFQRRRFEVVQKSVEKNRTKSGSGSVRSSNKQRTANAIPRFPRLHPFIPSRSQPTPSRFLLTPSRSQPTPSRFPFIPSRFNISFLPFNYFRVLLILLVTTSFKDIFVNFFHTFVSHCTVFQNVFHRVHGIGICHTKWTAKNGGQTCCHSRSQCSMQFECECLCSFYPVIPRLFVH